MEKAREIFDKCCIEIAASLADTGFNIIRVNTLQ